MTSCIDSLFHAFLRFVNNQRGIVKNRKKMKVKIEKKRLDAATCKTNFTIICSLSALNSFHSLLDEGNLQLLETAEP